MPDLGDALNAAWQERFAALAAHFNNDYNSANMWLDTPNRWLGNRDPRSVFRDGNLAAYDMAFANIDVEVQPNESDDTTTFPLS